ncbi:RNA-binding domain-containing protein [Panus rudis PR-1116 ss-1]|nr:RNA-binding domain-containing protein [Panus rudis PR-1116 ss-1]
MSDTETKSALGKRKERDGEPSEVKTHGSTIFVSNLPYSATSTDLKTLFSDLGPVRSAFVVLDQATGNSKGVGYVSFSIKEDAQLAYDRANNSNDEPIVLDGRKLRVTWADSKHHKDKQQHGPKDVQKEKEAKPKQPKAPQPSQSSSGSSDPLAIRTIVISGLPSSIDSKTLWKKIRKYEGAEKVEWPAKLQDGSEDKSTAYAIFSTPATAQEAVHKLHAHVFKGSLLSVTLKKRLDGLAKAAAAVKSKKAKTSAKNPTSSEGTDSKAGVKGPMPSRASRLIVRNLPFDITEQDLRSVFLPYGPIYSIHIPLKDPEVKQEDGDESNRKAQDAKPRARGYAFVWMLAKKDAERAIEGANGTKVWSGMAEEIVRGKQQKKKLRREEAKMKEAMRKRKEREAKAKADKNEAQHSGERIIAVDWALSKDKWEEAKAKIQEQLAEAGSEEGSGSESESEAGSESDDGSDSHIGVHDGESDDEGSDDEDDEDEDDMDVDDDDEDQQPGKPQLPPPETGTTLFVRNVPFEATDDELRTVFRAFGPLRYARITMDQETGRSRGTGFVCFWKKEDADKAIEQSEILRKETTGGEAPIQSKKNPFKLPSLLTPDPSAPVAQNLVLHGRTMDVVRAVTRDEATKLKEIGERQREKADKRNLYLLREGIILPNTPAAETIPQAELEARTNSFNARRNLLRTNPSLYVSKTRLSVRQLPLFVTERMLKRLAIHAIRSFNAEVKAGLRAPLTEDELAVPVLEDGEEAIPSKVGGSAVKGKGKGRSTGVKQAKIVRQQDRVDRVTGKGRSRGYGFLELETHADALRVLRWANNNREVNKLFASWWKEELEDLIKIEKKKEKEGVKREEGRLERLKSELEAGPNKRERGTLIVEFSIENIQVVKRRITHQHEQKTVNFIEFYRMCFVLLTFSIFFRLCRTRRCNGDVH